jgi:Xaa-Pro dipeptidase
MQPIGFSSKRASEMMRRIGVDVLIASSPENVFYASGLPTTYATINPILSALSNQYPNIVVIPVDGEECLIAWQLFRSVEKVSWIKKVSSILSRDEALQRLESIIKQVLPGEGTIGIESMMPIFLRDFLVRALPDIKIRISDDIFTDMRLEKSEEEIRRIQEATMAAERAMEETMGSIQEGISTLELAKIATLALAHEGTASPSHISISVGDSDPEYPDARTMVRRGDIAKLDLGAVYEGYCADVSRHATIDAVPIEAELLSRLMAEVQETCANAIKPGTKPEEAVDMAYSLFQKRGGQGFFFISIHSIGISVEDYTFYDTVMGSSGRPFKENMVLDIEASTILRQHGFIGVADPYLVTNEGCRRMSRLEKQIFRLSERKRR